MSGANWENTTVSVSWGCVRCCNRSKGGVCLGVCEEYNTIQLLLDLSAHCLQPLTARHINEVATNIFILSLHIVCVSRCKIKRHL